MGGRSPANPKQFRDAGHFWGIAPGTPPRVIRSRIKDVDGTLSAARALLDERQVDEIAASHGKALFDRADIERALAFQAALKQRFASELSVLQAGAG